MLRLFRLIVGSVMASSVLAAAPQTRGDTPAATSFYTVSYVEVMPSSRPMAIAALKLYRDASRKDDGYGRFELFEQVGRPGHFASVETWRDQKAFDAHGAAAQKQLLETLKPIRVSDYDQRPYKTLTVGSAPPVANGHATFVITHVDVTPDQKVPPLLTRLAEMSRQDEGNIRFDVLQHTMRANHFTVIETWRNPTALQAHAEVAHTRQYRDTLKTMAGSPLDERLYKVIQ